MTTLVSVMLACLPIFFFILSSGAISPFAPVFFFFFSFPILIIKQAIFLSILPEI